MLIIIFINLPIFLRSRKEKRNRNNNTSSLQDEVVNVSMRHLANNHSNESVKCGGTAVYEDFDTKDPLHSTPFKVMIKNKVSSMEPQSKKRKHSNHDSNKCIHGCTGNHDKSICTSLKFDDKRSVSPQACAIYSIPIPKNARTNFTSPSHSHADVNKTGYRSEKHQRVKSWAPEMAREESPTFLIKRQEFKQYLGSTLHRAAPSDHMNNIYGVPISQNKNIVTLTKAAIATESLCENPLYSSVDTDLNPSVTDGTSNSDNAYTEPDVSTSAETCKSRSCENIYESIHIESLQPSCFMHDVKGPESMDGLCPYSSIYTVPLIDTTMKEKILEVTMANIQKKVTLGAGNFGNVILAHTVGLSHCDLKIGKSTDRTISVPVAVKMLKDNASELTKKQFEKEYRFMFHLNHPNVVRLFGICMTETLFIMMEYMEKGDLNQILQRQYHKIVDDEDTPSEIEITQKMLIHICTQIASAMNYLASNNFVHRDLATRNCLVGQNFNVKVSDFGMSRSLYESHYYILRGKAILPVRWMATECFYGKFSAKTDVWAFGITMWEIFTLAKLEPYYGMSDKDLVQNAIRGPKRLLLSHPESCPSNVYEIMKCCWAHNASQRATFEQLHDMLLALEL